MSLDIIIDIIVIIMKLLSSSSLLLFQMPIIKLKSSDEEILDVDEEVAKTMLQGE